MSTLTPIHGGFPKRSLEHARVINFLGSQQATPPVHVSFFFSFVSAALITGIKGALITEIKGVLLGVDWLFLRMR